MRGDEGRGGERREERGGRREERRARRDLAVLKKSVQQSCAPPPCAQVAHRVICGADDLHVEFLPSAPDAAYRPGSVLRHHPS